MSACVIRWVGDGALALTERIRQQCVPVDGVLMARSRGRLGAFPEVVDGRELVWVEWDRDAALYADPSIARVARLWREGYVFWWVLIRLRRLGVWRVRDGLWLHTGWWSWPYRERDRAHWTPWERGQWSWWRQQRA